jgi:hypothetical protein
MQISTTPIINQHGYTERLLHLANNIVTHLRQFLLKTQAL